MDYVDTRAFCPHAATAEELAKAAQAYLSLAAALSEVPGNRALLRPEDLTNTCAPFWPWGLEWWQPHVDPADNFAVAVALCTEGIARLGRA